MPRERDEFNHMELTKDVRSLWYVVPWRDMPKKNIPAFFSVAQSIILGH